MYIYNIYNCINGVNIKVLNDMYVEFDLFR